MLRSSLLAAAFIEMVAAIALSFSDAIPRIYGISLAVWVGLPVYVVIIWRALKPERLEV